jgi:hypothetical protein
MVKGEKVAVCTSVLAIPIIPKQFTLLILVRGKGHTVLNGRWQEKSSLQIYTFLLNLPTIYNNQLIKYGLQIYNF